MKFRLYISNDCPACDRVMEFVTQNNIDHELINISDPGKNPVEGVMIYPALLNGDKLLAYGDDIIRCLERAA